MSGGQRFFFRLPRAVDDAVLGYSKQPCTGLLNGIGGDVELEQHILQDVVGLGRVALCHCRIALLARCIDVNLELHVCFEGGVAPAPAAAAPAGSAAVLVAAGVVPPRALAYVLEPARS